MRVQFQSVNFKADKKLVDYVQDRMDKLENYYDHIIEGEVFLKVDNTNSRQNKIVEMKVCVPGNDIMVKKESNSFESATDNATDVMRRQLTKRKEKERSI